ncbi:MAG: 2-phospho-L-lactate transferase [Pseudomonadales bacterium]
MNSNSKLVALTGGVGGAKLAAGLAAIVPPDKLLIVANTGDDFEHLGLKICPDLDSVMYALAGINDAKRGWGVKDESWQFLHALEQLNGETWFQLGDRDLATQIMRTQLLGSGQSLSQATKRLTESLGIKHRLVPMSDQPVRTFVKTATANLPFQQYFVAERCEPVVTGFYFDAVEQASVQADLASWLTDEKLLGVVICPSNPFVSVDPILALPTLRDALAVARIPVVAVSPLIAGRAIKGPAAKMMEELNMPRDALGVAQHYQGLVNLFVLDRVDAMLAPAIEELGMQTLVTPTLMRNAHDRQTLAQTIIDALN